MNKDDLTLIVILAALGVGFYIYKNKKTAMATPGATNQPGTQSPLQTAGTGLENSLLGSASSDITNAFNQFVGGAFSNSGSSNSTSGVNVTPYADDTSSVYGIGFQA